MTVVASQNCAQPVYRTATIRKLKRTHEDSLASSVSTNDSLRMSSSTIGSQFQPSRPILRSASVIKTKNIKNDLCHYGAYTDDQPENLIFRRGKFWNVLRVVCIAWQGFWGSLRGVQVKKGEKCLEKEFKKGIMAC